MCSLVGKCNFEASHYQPCQVLRYSSNTGRHKVQSAIVSGSQYMTTVLHRKCEGYACVAHIASRHQRIKNTWIQTVQAYLR